MAGPLKKEPFLRLHLQNDWLRDQQIHRGALIISLSFFFNIYIALLLSYIRFYTFLSIYLIFFFNFLYGKYLNIRYWIFTTVLYRMVSQNGLRTKKERGFFKENLICECVRSKQMRYTDQIIEILPQVRTYFWVII